MGSLRSGSTSLWRNTGMDVFSRSNREEDDEEALKWASLEKLPTFDRLKKGLLFGSTGPPQEVDVDNLGFEERKRLLDRLIHTADEDNEKFLLKLRNRIDRTSRTVSLDHRVYQHQHGLRILPESIAHGRIHTFAYPGTMETWRRREHRTRRLYRGAMKGFEMEIAREGGLDDDDEASCSVLVGIDLPTIEVKFEHMTVEADVKTGSRALPSFINFHIDLYENSISRYIQLSQVFLMSSSIHMIIYASIFIFLGLFHLLPNSKKHITILDDVSGIVKPSRMTLLLGPPSSGKTTLLLALAGKLDRELKSSGKVTYNGHELHEFVPERTSAYISQYDVHIGEMTVRETLAFSARCQGVGSRYEMLAELSRREKDANIKPDPDIDIFMKVLLMDEISTGLDSSTTFQIVKSLRQFLHILEGTAVISLLQPAPETYDLFDDIILLTDGKIVYQGPRDNVLEFFEFMGFKCPERKGVADFLQEVTSKKDQEQYWMRRDEHYRFVTAKEFADSFQSFHVGKRLGDDLATPYDKSRSHPAALTTEKYGLSKKELLKACVEREILLMKRNSFVYYFKLTQASVLVFVKRFCLITTNLFRLLFVMAVVAMTVFLRSKMHRDNVENGGIYLGSLFFGVVMIMFNGMSEISMTIAKLPVFYKQRDFLFYPSWAYALPSWIVKIPISFIEAGLWTILTYYVIGYDPDFTRFIKQFFLLLAINQMSSALFRFIGSLGRDMIVANTFGSFALLLIFVLGGFVLSRDDVKKWWLWGYWISPMMYAMNGIAPLNDTTLGKTIITSRGFFAEAYWYWIAVVASVGFVFLFNFCFTLCLEFLDPFGKSRPTVSSQSESDQSVVELNSTVGNQQSKKKGMILPFQPLSLTFNEVKYSVDMPQRMREQGVGEDRLLLLKSVSGIFRPGVLTALMGVSGAGKTTLMDVLAGRKTGGYIEGDIRISGYPKKQETFARISGYCEQNDIHSPHVTVYESLLYSAWLRLSPDVDENTRMMFVNEVMDLVELNPLRDALVGLPGINGLSTEQRKRLTIAVELVANPSIIFMDEPTSGLDARAAAIVMRTVRNTVDTGRTVVCTIHQPSIDIFEAFDELFLMKRGGEEIYVGPIGLSTSSQELALGVDFAEIYRNSELYRRNKALIAELSVPGPGTKDLYFPTQYSQSFFVQCVACLWKQRWSYWRNPSYTAVRFAFTAFIAIMFGTMFWDLGGKRKNQQELFNAMGSMYAATLFLSVQNASAVQPVVDIERTVFYRERAAGMYSALPYALAQALVEIPYVFAQTIVYCLIVYAMMGFEWTAAKFFWYTFFQFTCLMYMTYYGMMTVAVTPNANIAAIVAFFFYGAFNLFSGFIIPRPKIPVWWRWYYWGNPLAWTIYGMVVSQFGEYDDLLVNGETVKGYLDRYFGYKHDFLGAIAGVHIGLVIVFGFIFAYCIKSFNFQKR
ncbi:LOW QUALITY PROTEIN: hypothetical protein M8C21_009515 [Ambrosia artemisiifolia]|uniref:ABC transporter domain-containing protein n=1 Tax=Ambrosia artemisiifolia TaxID=4212 RepID=A0AAD5BQH7_AMBAR|nr:LOW QUALITY PROTEIN: hypothetical protein M8C21_009515 [Ambrosia artemisiifolia]